MDLELDIRRYVVEMVIADLRAKDILGDLDYLETNQCAINLPHETLTLKENDQIIPLYRSTTRRDKSPGNMNVVNHLFCRPFSGKHTN